MVFSSRNYSHKHIEDLHFTNSKHFYLCFAQFRLLYQTLCDFHAAKFKEMACHSQITRKITILFYVRLVFVGFVYHIEGPSKVARGRVEWEPNPFFFRFRPLSQHRPIKRSKHQKLRGKSTHANWWLDTRI
jgi:hypothetical protein